MSVSPARENTRRSLGKARNALRCTAMPKRVGWLAGIVCRARLSTMADSVAGVTGCPFSLQSARAGGDARASIHSRTCVRVSVAGRAARSCIDASSRSRRALRAEIWAWGIRTASRAAVRCSQNHGVSCASCTPITPCAGMGSASGLGVRASAGSEAAARASASQAIRRRWVVARCSGCISVSCRRFMASVFGTLWHRMEYMIQEICITRINY